MALGHWLKDYIGPHSGGSGGSGGGTEPLIVSLIVEKSYTRLDKTWQEIYDAFPNVLLDGSNAEAGMYQRTVINNVNGSDNDYGVVVGPDIYEATSASGYPKFDKS